MEIIRMRRKTISATCDDNGDLTVKVPLFASKKAIEAFLINHRAEIEKMIEAKKRRAERISSFSDEELYKRAREILSERLEHFSNLTDLRPVSVKITSAKTRYGSCSSKGRICFSKYLFIFERDIIDYVILHELAHLKYMNHSREFYAFIENIMPDYRERVKKLRSEQ